MKQCVRCKKLLPLDCFHIDRNSGRKDGRYPYCKDCRRAYYGHKKLPPREPRLCSFCGKVFYPRQWQVRVNVTGLFFCCDDHLKRFKQEHAASFYHGYRKYILERDSHRCVLCSCVDPLHVHHILPRGAGGTDEYCNLATLCAACHSGRAHGKEAAEVRTVLQQYTATFERPPFWDEIMAKSKRDRDKIKLAKRKAKRRFWRRMMNSPRAEEYRAKQRERQRRYQSEWNAERAKDNFRTATNTSGYRGVTYARGQWRASIRVNGRDYFCGSYPTREAAAQAYNRKAYALLGDKAKLNTVWQDVTSSSSIPQTSMKTPPRKVQKNLCIRCRVRLKVYGDLCIVCVQPTAAARPPRRVPGKGR